MPNLLWFLVFKIQETIDETNSVGLEQAMSLYESTIIVSREKLSS